MEKTQRIFNNHTKRNFQLLEFVYLLVFLFVLGFFISIQNFSLTWRRHYYHEGLKILTYAQHSWPLSSEGSLACHIYCDTQASIYNDHVYGPVTLAPIADYLAVELSLPVFTT